MCVGTTKSNAVSAHYISVLIAKPLYSLFSKTCYSLGSGTVLVNKKFPFRICTTFVLRTVFSSVFLPFKPQLQSY